MNTQPAQDSHLKVFLDDFLARQRPELLRHAASLMRGRRWPFDADDVVQNGTRDFCAYLHRCPTPELGERLATLARLFIESAFRALRRRAGGIDQPVPTEIEIPGAGPGPRTEFMIAADAAARAAALAAAIATLDPIDQDIVRLRLSTEATFASIGQQLGLSADAVRMRHARAVNRLRPLLLPVVGTNTEPTQRPAARRGQADSA
ncbi:MAG: sigma-70 family RNA polymerase sigma factor [Planctomycetes bacterium]|nr:sigma-70 family RNA polymerase sigma factor [Planctomycetota bacterium]